jgi:oxygen-independent coproporphyrinogen-3 oxidase
MTMSMTLPHLLSEKVPRYTSYPTAPHFSAAVGAEAYASWLRAIPADATLSLYLHVPFCAELCHYCGCHTKATRRREPIDAYAETLAGEIRLLSGELAARRIVHLHWGGGTPTMLGDRLRRVHAALAHAFDLAPQEHAIELDPRQVTPDLARMVRDIGVDRASLGVQDFSAPVQEAIGRMQPYEAVRRAVDTLREAGIDKINFDLMYGLPGQTVESVRHTAILADRLSPHRLSVFGYAHVPWMKPQQRLIDDAALPGPEARFAQSRAVHEQLIELGYRAIGLDHYARPGDDLDVAVGEGRCRRNFQGYTTDGAQALIGLGASAIGRLPQGYVQNAPDAGGYARAIAERRFATVRGLSLSAEDRLRGRVIERLMCDLAVDLDALAGDGLPSDRFAAELDSLAPLAQEDLIVLDGAHLEVTEKGRPYLRVVAAAFDTYLKREQTRHSLAV